MLVLPRSTLLPRNQTASTPSAFTKGCLMHLSRVRIRMLLVLPRSTQLPRNQPAPSPPALTAGCLMQPSRVRVRIMLVLPRSILHTGNQTARTPPALTWSAGSLVQQCQVTLRTLLESPSRPTIVHALPCPLPALAPVTANRLMGGGRCSPRLQTLPARSLGSCRPNRPSC